MRAIRIFISSSSTSDSARERRLSLLEQRLFLERLEIEILRERVDEILVGHRRRNLVACVRDVARAIARSAGASSASSFARCRRMAPRSSASSAPLRQRLDERAAVAALVILVDDAEPLDPAQHDVVAAVGAAARRA